MDRSKWIQKAHRILARAFAELKGDDDGLRPPRFRRLPWLYAVGVETPIHSGICYLTIARGHAG